MNLFMKFVECWNSAVLNKSKSIIITIQRVIKDITPKTKRLFYKTKKILQIYFRSYILLFLY